MEEHDRMRVIFKQERKRLTELGQKPSDGDVERMILTTLEEYCRQFNLGFYATDWNSKSPPQELTLNRVTT